MKKRMLKIFSVVLAMSISASLIVSCGGGAQDTAESTAGQIELVE